MSPAGLAILGSGIFAKEAHLPAIAALDSGVAELKAVYSRSLESATELAAEAQALLNYPASPSIYHDTDPDANLDTLLARSDIAAVAIALPITVQPAIIRKALAAGKHVLSEKPVGKDVATGLELIKEYEESYKPKGLVWRIAENYEVEPGYQAAGEVIKSGKIGKVAFYNATAVNYMVKSNKYYNTPWRTVPDYQGGFLLDGGVHTIAALRIILSVPMISVSAFASLVQDYLPPQDTINAIVHHADGSHGVIALTWGAPTDSRRKLGHSGITITGTDGWVSIENVTTSQGKGALRITTRVRVTDEHGIPVGETEEVVEHEVSGVKEEFKRFFKAVGGENDGYGKPFDALTDVAWIQAALNSNGAPVDLQKLVQA